MPRICARLLSLLPAVALAADPSAAAFGSAFLPVSPRALISVSAVSVAAFSSQAVAAPPSQFTQDQGLPNKTAVDVDRIAVGLVKGPPVGPGAAESSPHPEAFGVMTRAWWGTLLWDLTRGDEHFRFLVASDRKTRIRLWKLRRSLRTIARQRWLGLDCNVAARLRSAAENVYSPDGATRAVELIEVFVAPWEETLWLIRELRKRASRRLQAAGPLTKRDANRFAEEIIGEVLTHMREHRHRTLFQKNKRKAVPGAKDWPDIQRRVGSGMISAQTWVAYYLQRNQEDQTYRTLRDNAIREQFWIQSNLKAAAKPGDALAGETTPAVGPMEMSFIRNDPDPAARFYDFGRIHSSLVDRLDTVRDGQFQLRRIFDRIAGPSTEKLSSASKGAAPPVPAESAPINFHRADRTLSVVGEISRDEALRMLEGQVRRHLRDLSPEGLDFLLNDWPPTREAWKSVARTASRNVIDQGRLDILRHGSFSGSARALDHYRATGVFLAGRIAMSALRRDLSFLADALAGGRRIVEQAQILPGTMIRVVRNYRDPRVPSEVLSELSDAVAVLRSWSPRFYQEMLLSTRAITLDAPKRSWGVVYPWARKITHLNVELPVYRISLQTLVQEETDHQILLRTLPEHGVTSDPSFRFPAWLRSYKHSMPSIYGYWLELHAGLLALDYLTYAAAGGGHAPTDGMRLEARYYGRRTEGILRAFSGIHMDGLLTEAGSALLAWSRHEFREARRHLRPWLRFPEDHRIGAAA